MALVRDPRVDKIAFTGSTDVGKTIMREAAGTLKRLSLELGGKSPNIVFADADMDAAVKGAMTGIFYNKGEVCAAGSRLFVEEKIHDAFLAQLTEKAKGLKVGDPMDRATRMGPVVSKQQMETVLGYIEAGKKEGARLVAGGGRANVGGGKGYFVEPTIFDGVTNTMKIAREEIFGPVLSVIPFKSVEAGGERRALGGAADEHDDLARGEDRPDAERHRPVADRALDDLVGEDVAHGPRGEAHEARRRVELAPRLVRGDVRVRPEPHHDEVEAARALERLLVLAAHRLEVGCADVERVAALRRHARPGQEFAPHLSPEVPVGGCGRAELVDREDTHATVVDRLSRLPVAQARVHASRRAPRRHRHGKVGPGGEALAEQCRRRFGELRRIAEDDDLHPRSRRLCRPPPPSRRRSSA